MSLDVNILPIPKKLYDDAKAVGVKKIFIELSGGSDEGYCSVNVSFANNDTENNPKRFECIEAIEEWANEVYGDEYNGAGDGTDYGDDITYDLENNTASTNEWVMRRVDFDVNTEELKIE